MREELLDSLCLPVVQVLVKFLHTATGRELRPGVVAVIQTSADSINVHRHIHVLIIKGGTTQVGAFHRVPVIERQRIRVLNRIQGLENVTDH